MYTLTPLQRTKLRLASLPREIQGSREMVYVQCEGDDKPQAAIVTGSFGCVCPYATDSSRLAVKWFYHSSGPASSDEFAHELKAVRAMAHSRSERISGMLDFNISSRWIAYEWVPNGELFHFIRRAPLPEGIALYYLRQVLEALDALHSLNICHLDVKTDNLMLDENYQLKLVDFSGCFLHTPGEINNDTATNINRRAVKLRLLRSHHVPPDFRLPSGHSKLMALSPQEKLVAFEKADIWEAAMAALTMCTGCYCFSEPHLTDSNLRVFAALILKDPTKFWGYVGGVCDAYRHTLSISDATKQLMFEMMSANHLERPSAAELLDRPILVAEALPTPEEVCAFMRNRGQ